MRFSLMIIGFIFILKKWLYEFFRSKNKIVIGSLLIYIMRIFLFDLNFETLLIRRDNGAELIGNAYY